MALRDELTRWWRSLAGSDSQSRLLEQARDAETDDDEPADPDAIVVMPIEEAIDLHHFPPRDIPSVVTEYLLETQKAGFREVRVIHGKGKGIQRQRVHSLLATHPAVQSYRSDGLGSTLVTLHPPK